MKKLFLILLLLPFILGGAPSRTKTYTSGEVINPSDVTENEDNLFRYVQTGVDTYADSTIVSADITDGTVVNADISGSAAITYGKLSFSNNIVAGDIATDAVDTAEIKDGSIVNADISSSAAIDASKIADGTVSSTEFQYINSLSSNAQTQIANILSGTTSFSGLTASADLDIGTYELRANTLESDVATGTAPLTVASTTKVTNLNAETVDGFEGGTGIPSNIQVFTSTGTWTKPANVSTVWVKVWGAGGSGRSAGSGENSGGGGSGAYAEGLVTVTGDVTVTVGTGGTVTGGPANGNTGGSSSFGTAVVAGGGSGGASGSGGAGGSATAGTIQISGNGGMVGLVDIIGGAGGSTPFGAGTAVGPKGAVGLVGQYIGGGGSGGGSTASTGYNGGAGANGLVIVCY